MGTRFGRFRAAWADTWTNPWKGIPWRDQRRFGKLARSGQLITDPEDAERVRDYVFWIRRLAQRWLLFMGFFVLIDLVTVAARLASGHPFRFDKDVIYVCLAVPIAALYWWLLRRDWRTAEANGWTRDGQTFEGNHGSSAD
jgi:hypothetical protein